MRRRYAQFQRLVLDHYRRNRRDLPWRNTHDPYAILVSELMLQQTQVERVIKFYEPFLKRFPTPATLAKAPLSSVLRSWQGLGYNRRAKFLHAAARQIKTKYAGKVPQDEESLVALPGIGRNTAGAIRAFAFDQPAIFIETNIRRVFLHQFFSDRVNVSDADILKAIAEALPKRKYRDWYYALMDYGATLGRDRKLINPNRRSKSYHVQAAFEGSLRQARSIILKALLARKRLSIERGAALTGIQPARFAMATRALEREKFIKRQGNYFVLL